MFRRNLRYFVAYRAGLIVRDDNAPITIFASLPRRAFIITRRQYTFRLELVLWSKIAFDARFFQARQCNRFGIFGFPFHPYTAVRPSTTVFRPFNANFFFSISDNGRYIYTSAVNSIQINGIANRVGLIKFCIA